MSGKHTDYTTQYPKWNKSMKQTYKLLAPDMLPWHFLILEQIFRLEGYDLEVLKNDSLEVVDEGLKHVHNDACYPCLCVVGQFINALKSGKYDLEHTAVIMTQTGGGCRASNYAPLIRKAIAKEFPQVPVVSINFSGLEKQNSLEIGAKLFLKIAYGILYADGIMWCYNQTRPYEKEKGAADAAREKAVNYTVDKFAKGGYRKYKEVTKEIIKIFSAVPRTAEKKVKVGIVGEIYVKYSALANNGLEKFLLSENCEPVVPPLMDFMLYCVINVVNDYKFYGHKRFTAGVYKLIYNVIHRMQKNIIKIYEKDGSFSPVHDFERLRTCADKILNQGVKMGEGWLIPAEIAAFGETGVTNVICAQPFGCLPNHIAGKGTIRTLKNAYPDENIVAVDYDPSATKVNQENRIKLMLATAKEKL